MKACTSAWRVIRTTEARTTCSSRWRSSQPPYHVFHARVVRLGRSSMTVDVRAALDAAPGTRPQEVLRASFEMVAVDANGRPVPLAPRDDALAPAALNDQVL